MILREQSDTLPLGPAAFRAMNDTLNSLTSCRHYQGVRTNAEPQKISKASGRHKIRNMCDKGTRTTHACLCHIFRIQAKNYVSVMSHKAIISLPRLPSQPIRSLPYRKSSICQLTSRCSSRSTYWRSSPLPPTLSRRPLQDATHRCSTDLHSMAATPSLGHRPHALPSTRL